MSLLRLLNIGSSLARMRDAGRYHAAKNPFVLPKFGAGQKPEGQVAQAAPAVPAQPVAKPAKPAKPEPAAESATQTGGSRWWKRANPFATATARPVQVELTLDKVQVMRNDLMDADIEIVAKAPPGTTLPKKRYVRPDAQPDELGKKAWGMLGSRLFGGAAAKH
jgi:hypothetical protein